MENIPKDGSAMDPIIERDENFSFQSLNGTTTKDAIVLLNKAGFSAIPTNKKTKKPFFAWAEYQKKKPRITVVEYWCEQYKDFDIALLMGEVNDLFAIDIDRKDLHQYYIDEFQDRGIVDNVVIQETNKGYHYIFSYPKNKNFRDNYYLKTKNFHNGIECKSSRSTIHIAPSTNKRILNDVKLKDIVEFKFESERIQGVR